ncbi:MAG: competence protein [Bacteroidetes bacterium HGW-Bacteroidetes-2]|jgi:competence protein ComEC|nr:MAG: competence protein [Bacteroidetes bacterium HGW-Bacteroidetes-2]
MRLISITSFKITLVFLLGILCSRYIYFETRQIHFTIIIIALVLLLAWLRARKQFFQDVFFGWVTYVALFGLGVWVYYIHQPMHQHTHYTQKIIDNQSYFIQLKILEKLKPDLYNQKYIAQVLGINETKASGSILVLFPKDSGLKKLQVDKVLLLKTAVENLPQSKNPNQFDYASYLNQKGIYHQIKVNSNEILSITNGSISMKGIASYVRTSIQDNLVENHFEGNALALINALLLGQRQDLSEDVYRDFAAAGAVHILAVSGLHVGIIMLLLQFIFKPLERIKKGKDLKIIIIVICLWIFAIVAGLSPSVLRAALMFSFLTYAMESNRPTSTLNTLFTSAFVLLLIDPNLLFHVGFQMSYLAVFSIFWITPLLAKFYSPKFYLDKLIWGIFTVTIAAQIGVGPLSIYYFNYFPGLFFVTNLVILPFLGILLGMGIIVIFLASTNLLPTSFSIGYSYILDYMIRFISWIASKDSYLFEDLSMSKVQLILFYLMLISIFLYVQKMRFLRFVLITLIFLQLTYISEKIPSKNQELILFHKSKNTIIGHKNGNKLAISTLLDSSKISTEKLLKGYLIKNQIKEITSTKVHDIFQFNSEIIVVVDSLGVYPTLEKDVALVILRNSPKIHLERLLDSLKPKKLVADGSNYTSYVSRWRETCKKRKLPFHYTGSEGAFVLKSN